MTSSSWQARAACRGRPTALWFASDPATVAVAQTICRACPVRRECLAEALAVEAGAYSRASGIFGGLTGRDRDRLLGRVRSTSSTPDGLDDPGALQRLRG